MDDYVAHQRSRQNYTESIPMYCDKKNFDLNVTFLNTRLSSESLHLSSSFRKTRKLPKYVLYTTYSWTVVIAEDSQHIPITHCMSSNRIYSNRLACNTQTHMHFTRTCEDNSIVFDFSLPLSACNSTIAMENKGSSLMLSHSISSLNCSTCGCSRCVHFGLLWRRNEYLLLPVCVYVYTIANVNSPARRNIMNMKLKLHY